MRVPSRLLVPVLGLAALAVSGPPASATPICTGTAEHGLVCVDPAGSPGVGVQQTGAVHVVCVFVPLDPTCHSVDVPLYGVVSQPGPTPLVSCTGPCLAPVGPVLGIVDSTLDPENPTTKPYREAVEEETRCTNDRAAVRPGPGPIDELQICIQHG